MQKKAVVIIAGPTASGKSQLAIDVALGLGGVVINADSMQVYKDTPILSACPSKDDKAKIPHRLYEIYSSDKKGTVVDWLNLAVDEIKSTWSAGKVPVVVGGTGLYIDNLINGTTPIPEASKSTKEKVAKMLADKGVKELYAILKGFDEETAFRLSENDTSRIRRALEVFYETGTALSVWHKMPMVKKAEAEFLVVKILPPKADLDKRCDMRLDLMVEEGALQEVENLQRQGLDKDLPAMKALGVPELMSFLEGKVSLQKAVELAKTHTRQYAKRQKTWFKNKLAADVELTCCYKGEKDVLKSIFTIAQKRFTG